METIADIEKKVTLSDIERFAAKNKGRGAAQVLSILGKRRPFMDAISTEVGQELLSDVVEQMQLILAKIIDDTATPTEVADFRAYKAISERWAKRISTYIEFQNKLLGKE